MSPLLLFPHSSPLTHLYWRLTFKLSSHTLGLISPYLHVFFWIILILLSLHHLLSLPAPCHSLSFSRSPSPFCNFFSSSLRSSSFPAATSSWVPPWWLYLWDKLGVRHEMFFNFSASAACEKWAEIKSKKDDGGMQGLWRRKRVKKSEMRTDRWRQTWDEHMEEKDRKAFTFYTTRYHSSRWDSRISLKE